MNSSPRLHQLDGLRAIAVFAVMVHHAGVASLATWLSKHGHEYSAHLLASGTAAGVELFYVLSGVLLLRPYLRQRRKLNVPQFYQRRIQRLWPPYLAAWLIGGAAIWFSTNYPNTWTSAADIATFSWPAWLAQLGIFYVGREAFNAAWWSLNVELLFYAIVPIIVYLLVRRSLDRTQMTWLWLASIAVSLLAQLFPWSGEPHFLEPFVSLVLYASCFTTGVLLASHDPPASWARISGAAGIIYVLVACAWPQLNWHIGWGLIAFGLVLSAWDPASALARKLGSWLLVWIGERSYSLFLVHISIFNVVNQVVSMFLPHKGVAFFLASRLIGLPLAMLAAMVIFSVVERRFAHNLVTAANFWPVENRRSGVVASDPQKV